MDRSLAVPRARFCLIVLGLLGSLPPPSLRAQVCSGFPSLDEHRFRLAAGAADYAHATALAVSLTAGRKGYGTVAVGRTRDGELDAWTVDLGFETGADLPLDAARRLFVCPVAAVSTALGPHDFLLSGADYDTFGGALGLGVAAVVGRSRALVVLAFAGLRAVLEETSFTPSAYARRYGVVGSGWDRDLYTQLHVGLGVAFRRALTIRPELRVPFGQAVSHQRPPLGGPYAFAAPLGREGDEASLGISVGFTFGRRP